MHCRGCRETALGRATKNGPTKGKHRAPFRRKSCRKDFSGSGDLENENEPSLVTRPSRCRSTQTMESSPLPAAALPPRDDLYDALLAVKGLNAEDSPPVPNAELRISGCRRLAELIHNQPAHKLEALDRGAMDDLKGVFETHGDHYEVLIHASRAIRSLSFKSDEGRDHVQKSGIILCMGTTLLGCVAALERLDPLVSGDVDHLVGAVDEIVLALTAACSRHGG